MNDAVLVAGPERLLTVIGPVALIGTFAVSVLSDFTDGPVTGTPRAVTEADPVNPELMTVTPIT